MTTSDRALSLTDTDRALLRGALATLHGDPTSREGRTMATLFRAADQTQRGIRPVTRSVRFASLVADQPGPTIGEVLGAAGIVRAPR